MTTPEDQQASRLLRRKAAENGGDGGGQEARAEDGRRAGAHHARHAKRRRVEGGGHVRTRPGAAGTGDEAEDEPELPEIPAPLRDHTPPVGLDEWARARAAKSASARGRPDGHRASTQQMLRAMLAARASSSDPTAGFLDVLYDFTKRLLHECKDEGLKRDVLRGGLGIWKRTAYKAGLDIGLDAHPAPGPASTANPVDPADEPPSGPPDPDTVPASLEERPPPDEPPAGSVTAAGELVVATPVGPPAKQPSVEPGDTESCEGVCAMVRARVGASASFGGRDMADAAAELATRLWGHQAGAEEGCAFSGKDIVVLVPLFMDDLFGSKGRRRLLATTLELHSPSSRADGVRSAAQLPSRLGGIEEGAGEAGLAVGQVASRWAEVFRAAESKGSEVERVQRLLAEVDLARRWEELLKNIEGDRSAEGFRRLKDGLREQYGGGAGADGDGPAGDQPPRKAGKGGRRAVSGKAGKGMASMLMEYLSDMLGLTQRRTFSDTVYRANGLLALVDVFGEGVLAMASPKLSSTLRRVSAAGGQRKWAKVRAAAACLEGLSDEAQAICAGAERAVIQQIKGAVVQPSAPRVRELGLGEDGDGTAQADEGPGGTLWLPARIEFGAGAETRAGRLAAELGGADPAEREPLRQELESMSILQLVEPAGNTDGQ